MWIVLLCREANDYSVDAGHIYSTIDDFHFRSPSTDWSRKQNQACLLVSWVAACKADYPRGGVADYPWFQKPDSNLLY